MNLTDIDMPLVELADVLDLVQNWSEWANWVLIGSPCENKPNELGLLREPETCPIVDGWIATRLLALQITDPVVGQLARELSAMLVRIQKRRDRLYGGKIDWWAMIDGVAALTDFARSGIARSEFNTQAAASFISAVGDAVQFAVNVESERAAVDDEYRSFQEHAAQGAATILRTHEKVRGNSLLLPSIVPAAFPINSKDNSKEIAVPCPYLDAVIVSIPALRCVAVLKPTQERMRWTATAETIKAGWTPERHSLYCTQWRLADLNWFGGSAPGQHYRNDAFPEWPSEPIEVMLAIDGVVTKQLVAPSAP